MTKKTERAGDKNKFLKGGFNFATGKSKPLEIRKSAPVVNINESDLQSAFFAILRQNEPRPPVRTRRGSKQLIVEPILDDPKYLNHPLYIFTRVRHFPNGGFRHASVAEQLFLEGVRPGAFDIYLDAARHNCSGLRIEMKAADGELSDYQIEEMRWLRAENYSAHVCYHYVEAMEVLLWYTGVDRKLIRGYPPSPHSYQLPAQGHEELCGCGLELTTQ